MEQKVNILIVDDLPEKLLVFQSVLEDLQQNLVLVRSGREALQQLLERDFAVILLDVNMPDIDGFETAKLIRQYRRTKQTPIVFITAYMDEVQSARGYALGAVDYISTPVVPEILRSKIKVFVDLYRMQLQLQRQAEEREALARAEAARDAAQVAMRRADLLAEASHILTRSLDIEAKINDLLAFAIPNFAPLGMVMLFDNGKLTHARLACYDEDYQCQDVRKIPLALQQVIERFDGNGDLPELSDKDVEILRCCDFMPATLRFDAAKLLPMFTRDKLIGVIILVHSADCEESADDDNLLREIAGRAAIAIENALLYRAIREGDRHKNEFLAMLSHELRNPLAPICNAVHILRTQPEDKKQRWATDVISRQVDQMTHIMNDLLDVSRIARGIVTIDRQKILLRDVIERSLETSRPFLESHQHRLSVDQFPYEIELQGDSVRLAQVFSNLLNNAIKYSPNGSDIWLKTVYRDEEVEISVRDNGYGIAAEFMPHIFDLFTQGDRSMERAQSGLGVGLTLVKHLIALHCGSIEARSEGIGKGAEFIVKLPARRAERKATVPVSANAAAAAPCGRVLIVDDLEASAQSMKLLLEVKGYEVEAVYDGLSALEAVAQCHPDIVLLDIGLPGMDGFEVSRRLHSMGEPVPFIVALTGYGQAADRAKTAEAGFDAHIVKPADIDKLLTLIANYCAKRTHTTKKIKLA